MAAIEAFALSRRVTPTGLPFTAAPRNQPVLATGRPGISERGYRSVLLTVGGRGESAGTGGRGVGAGVGPNGGSVLTGSMDVAATGGSGRSGATR